MILNIIWFERFLEDYNQNTRAGLRKTETEILEKFAEIGYDYDFFIISVDEEISSDGRVKMFEFLLVEEDGEKAMKYSGYIDG